MADRTEPYDQDAGAVERDAAAILIRWDAIKGMWVFTIEDLDPLSAIGILHQVVDAIAADAELAVAWDTDTDTDIEFYDE